MGARRLVYGLVGLVLLAGAGVGGYLLAPEADPSASPSPASSDVSFCTNTADGFTVAYPAGWYTTHLATENACEFFSAKSFTIPGESDFCCTELEVLTYSKRFAASVRDLTDTKDYRVLSRADVTVAGLPAIRIERESTGEGPEEQGTLIYGYVVDRGARGVIDLHTFRFPDRAGDYETRKALVDRAAATLRLF